MARSIGVMRFPMRDRRALRIGDVTASVAADARSFAAVGVAIYAFTVPFQRSFEIPGLGSPATAAAALTLVPVALAMFGPLEHRFPRWLLAQAVLTVIVVWNLGASRLPTEALDPYLRGLGPTVAKQAIQLLVMTWIVWEFVSGRAKVAMVSAAYVAGCYLALVDSIGNIGVKEVGNRITGSEAAQPNVQALVFAIGVPLAWYAYQQARHPLVRLVMLGYAPAGLAGILLTGSRSGFGAYAIALLCIALSFRSASVPLRAVVVVAIAATVPFVPSLLPEDSVERAVSTLEDTAQTNTDLVDRGALWDIGLDVAAEHPWFGAGQGSVRERVVDTTAGSNELSSHNSVINIAAEYGFPAAAVFALIYLTLLGQALKTKGFGRSVALGLALPVAVIMQVVNWEWEKANWLALALAACVIREHRQHREPAGRQTSVALR